LIGHLGQRFADKVAYMRRYAQRDLDHEGKGVINREDPRVEYFRQCQQDLNLALPILDKVCRKTIMLQEYTLSPGHCRGLAVACQFFDHQYVNRVFFSNCGIDDHEFASILEGLNHLKDFKSIIYKANHFAEQSLLKLRPLLLKRLPNHLLELKLIDCHMNSSHVSTLLDLLLETKSQLSQLALVNAKHSEQSFEKVLQFVKTSEHLKELDLSWAKLSLV